MHTFPSNPCDILLTQASLTKGETLLLQKFTITFSAQKWTCLIGPSGCGKTTLLRILAGLEQVSPQSALATAERQQVPSQTCYMAQKDLLVPWLDIQDNVLLGLRLRGQKITVHHRMQARELLSAVSLTDSINKRPQILSGGMRQRAALARTLLENRPIVLMDEPFSAVDALTRLRLQDLASSLLTQHTVILVTHDPLEALRLGHLIIAVEGPPLKIRASFQPPDPPPRSLDSIRFLHDHLLQLLKPHD